MHSIVIKLIKQIWYYCNGAFDVHKALLVLFAGQVTAMSEVIVTFKIKHRNRFSRDKKKENGKRKANVSVKKSVCRLPLKLEYGQRNG